MLDLTTGLDVRCQMKLELRPVFGSLNWPEALHLGSSGRTSRNMSNFLLNACNGWLVIDEMLRGRQFHRLEDESANDEARAISAGL